VGIKAPYRIGTDQKSGHFYQGVPAASFPAEWPQFDYATFKQLALAHGRYYSTDASGNIYRDGIEDNAHRIDFLTEFGVENHATAPYDLIFIDTVNGTPSVDAPPAADGSNLAHISANGSNLGLKGIFYLGAHFSGTGLNNGTEGVTMESPYGTTNNSVSIFLNGVMYAAGTMALQGGTNVYGSVVTQLGFTGGGTPDVYYNKSLADGLTLGNGNTGSPFKVTLQNNY
jgi:hypothetical protein